MPHRTKIYFMTVLRLFVVLILSVVPLSQSLRADEKPLLVFAAISMKNALEPIAVQFEKQTGLKVTFSFAGTSTLARQIAAGAPADLFISADIDWAGWLQVQNLTLPETQRTIATNRLALAAPVDSSFSDKQSISQILNAWRKSGAERMAVADPEHVPAGRYARSALMALESLVGSYASLEKRFAIAGNVRLASLLIARKEVPLGIVYNSDIVIEPGIKLVGLFPSESHADIVYPAVRPLDGRPEADLFIAYLGSKTAQKYLEEAGFSLPTRGL